MTVSLVAVVTDAVRDGRRVVGYGFNSNGRYGQGGLIRERFAPRLLEAEPETLLNEAGDNLDPDRVWRAMMANEKPGGHGERSVAVGTIDMAVWDAVAKIAGQAALPAAGRASRRRRRSTRVRLCRRRVLLSGQEPRCAACRDAQLPRSRLHGREDEDWRRGDGRGPAAHRSGAGGDRRRRRSSRWMRTAASIWRRPSRMRSCCASIRCSGTRKRATRSITRLQAALADYYPAPMATGENLFSHQDARNLLRYGGMRPDRDWLQFDCALSYGLCEYLRTLEVLADGRLVAASLHSARRPPDVAEYRRRPGAGRERKLSRSLPALWRVSGFGVGRRRTHPHARPAGHRLRREVGSHQRDARPRQIGVGQHLFDTFLRRASNGRQVTRHKAQGTSKMTGKSMMGSPVAVPVAPGRPVRPDHRHLTRRAVRCDSARNRRRDRTRAQQRSKPECGERGGRAGRDGGDVVWRCPNAGAAAPAWRRAKSRRARAERRR